MSITTADVAIAGGGIVGAACAEAFAREGLRVALVESGDVAGGATAAGMGHVVTMDDSEDQFALTAYSSRLWRELSPSLPATVQSVANGTLWIAADGEEMNTVRAKHTWYRQRLVACEILDAKQTAAAEPRLRPGLAGSLRVPGDRVIYAPCAAYWLMEQARARGAWVRHGVDVLAAAPNSLRLSDDSHISAAVVVVAAGTGSRALVPGLPLRPRKGHLAITDRYPGFLGGHQLVELGYLKSAHGHDNESVAFNVQPRSGGQVLIGSSRQYDVEDAAVEPPMLARMLERAVEYVPSLGSLSVIRTWTGFRAATPDSLPLIGPTREGLYLAAGHEGLGITTSLATARLLVDQVLRREPEIPWEPYLPARFDAEHRL